MHRYPCPLDKNGEPVLPGEIVLLDEEEVQILGISSPISVLIVKRVDDQMRVEDVLSNTVESARRYTGQVIVDAYNLGKRSKKKDRQKALEILFEEYNREFERELNVVTSRQELANSEQLKIINEQRETINALQNGDSE